MYGTVPSILLQDEAVVLGYRNLFFPALVLLLGVAGSAVVLAAEKAAGQCGAGTAPGDVGRKKGRRRRRKWHMAKIEPLECAL